MQAKAVSGVWAAAVTPFNSDMSVDLGALHAHVDWLLANGCDGVALLGTTGEAASIGINERLALIEDVAGNWPSDKVLIGVGSTAIPDTVTMIRAAQDHEMPNVLMLPPFYFKGVSDEGLYQVWSEVLRRSGQGPLHVHVYDFPAFVGFPLSSALQARLHRDFPERIVGMKDSSGDFAKMLEVVEAAPGFRVFAGTEALLLDILKAGGAGCISATVNVTAPAAAAVWRCWQAGDLAGAEVAQARLTELRTALQAFGMVPGMKALLNRAFPDRIGPTIRPPLLALPAAERDRLFATMDAAGLDLD